MDNSELAIFNGLLPALLSEARKRRVAMGLVFAFIALAAVAMGLLWPKKYEASTTILAQESSIITPLMEGAASPTGNKNRAGIAHDVIFSRKVMQAILVTGGWMAGHPSPVEQDRLIEGIKERTHVQTAHDNLITISYFDSDPKRAFEVTRQFAHLFISESLASKKRESHDAYDFINSQVEAYRKKLTDAEDKLKVYRDANADARPGSEAETDSRISQLRTQIENTRMDLMEKRSQTDALASQLSGESEVNAVQTTAGVDETRLAQLRGQLDKLLLTYTDQYPDVIRVRHQMDDLRQQLAQADRRKRDAQLAGTPVPVDASMQMNPLYQQLKLQLSAARGDMAASSARIGVSESMLQSELERSRRIANSENVTSELTRDYNVNRDVYQDLLKRRENARVSMKLDDEQRGLTFLIQNPAVLPLTPSGLRFMHFSLAGIVLALAVPLGLLFALVRFDPRIRSVGQLERVAGVMVLATVPYYPSLQDRQRSRVHNMLLVVVVAAVAAVYLVLFLLKLRGGGMNHRNDNVISKRFSGAMEISGSGFAGFPVSGHEISRMDMRDGVLAPRQLEQRRMIHREPSVRRHSDAFREIRTRLLEMSGQQNFVTLVVSVSSRSGGSFVARNLAAAFAFDETKTSLLIDCNLRYPDQHKVLDVNPVAGGLIDLIDHPAMGVETVLYQTGIPRLRLIPAGNPRENNSEYFSSLRMRNLLDSMRFRYADRYLFLDGPAIKGSPDARILSDMADFVVVVAGYGKDTSAAISQAAANFAPDKLAGVVFNQGT